MPDATTYDRFIEQQAAALRARDTSPTSREQWATRRRALRESLLAAIGPMPDKPCPLEPELVGTLKRDGYRIEKLLFQSRPEVWITSSLYLPQEQKDKAPAVLVVHGHWPYARRDPVVQARCLGLVKLGFVVLAIDAFSAGERHPTISRGSYHGALLGSTLWPTGLTLLGLQVYDNRRAVDYLLTRPEVDGNRLGITGASGGGNQSMYAGALDERLAAVVPVCSVGRYQAYLKAACCVCEVLPGALRFTEEGDVLGLVAPRALLVINATKDAFQFSVGEAKKSLERTRAIYKLFNEEERLQHGIFESPHDYNQAMREAMYGFMTRWLKGEGNGSPIPEPKHQIEPVEELACWPPGKRPASFLFAPDLAAREANRLLAWQTTKPLDHRSAWEAHTVVMRAKLEEALGGLPPASDSKARQQDDQITLQPELGIEIVSHVREATTKANGATAVVVHLDGAAKALAQPLVNQLTMQGWAVVVPELRATGTAAPKNDAIAGAPDHNSAEHGLWIGRPLIGQWLADLRAVLQQLAPRPVTLIGVGQAGLLVGCAAALLADRLRGLVLLDSPTSWVTSTAYPSGTRMGLLAPGLLRAGDLPHLLASFAPNKLLVVGGFATTGKKLDLRGLESAFAFTRKIYRLYDADKAFRLSTEASQIVEEL